MVKSYTSRNWLPGARVGVGGPDFIGHSGVASTIIIIIITTSLMLAIIITIIIIIIVTIIG